MTRKSTQEDDMLQLALFDTDRAEFPGEVAMWDVTMTELNPDCMPDAVATVTEVEVFTRPW